MTIHHDKLAYGKLASSREEVSEDRLAEMLKKLNAAERGENGSAGGQNAEASFAEEMKRLDAENFKADGVQIKIVDGDEDSTVKEPRR